MPAPRVSVVIPTYEARGFIASTLADVRAQTFSGWEAIVSDDASSDGTAEAVEALGDPRVRVVRAERNTGPAGARNRGLAVARGELVAFLDADDGWVPQYLERQVAAYDAAGPGVGIVACDATLRRDGRALPGTYLSRVRGTGDLTLDRLLRANAIYVSALVPRAVGEAVGWFEEDLFGTEDHDLWLRILEAGHRAVLNPEPLGIYTVAEGSVASDLGRMARNHQRTLERALARGRLTPRQRRIARAELRYHRAMELVADAALGGRRSPVRLARSAPLLAAVVATNPGRWGDWWRALRARGRVDAAA